jgi:leucyl aminopeptidase
VKIEVVSSTAIESGWVTIRFHLSSDQLPDGVSSKEFCGRRGTVLYLRDRHLLIAGLGDIADRSGCRIAAGASIMFLKNISVLRARFDLVSLFDFADAALEGSILADYRFERYLDTSTPHMEAVRFAVPEETVETVTRRTQRAIIVANATNYARSVANQPGNVLYPETLADEACRLAKRERLRVSILTDKEFKIKRFGGMLAVGGGSARGPRLITLEHRGGNRMDPPIALVGKAITFDAGGISIKSREGMHNMIYDKCGGIAVLGAMAGIAQLDIRRNVVGIIPSAENMPGSAAYRPGDILTTYGQTHVEIQNTDAEGRIILADAITYARLDYKAGAIVDLATLTGACGVALGDAAAGLWSTSDSLRDQLLSSSEFSGERLWPMPLLPEYDEAIKSDVARLRNVGGKLAGACTAAAFLKAFTGDTPWAHLDIAYMANLEKPRSELARGATGFGVRTLISFVERWPD